MFIGFPRNFLTNVDETKTRKDDKIAYIREDTIIKKSHSLNLNVKKVLYRQEAYSHTWSGLLLWTFIKTFWFSTCSNRTPDTSLCIYLIKFGWVTLFNNISTFVGYLMPKPSFEKEQYWYYLTPSWVSY